MLHRPLVIISDYLLRNLLPINNTLPKLANIVANNDLFILASSLPVFGRCSG